MSLTNPTIGEIAMFGGNYAPRGWALCNGQLLSISENQALFSLIGTIYGGDGRSNFKLPDLRGRVPMHAGTGPSLSTRKIGQRFGTETNTMTILEMPKHVHTASFKQTQGVVTGKGTIPVHSAAGAEESSNPAEGILTTGSTDIYTSEPTDGNYGGSVDVTGSATVSGTVTVNLAGGQQPQNNIQPVEVVNFIIALEGIFPSRS